MRETDETDQRTFIDAVKKNPASVIEGVICFFAVWSIFGLAGFHTYLTTSNQTTNEDIKGSFNARRGQEGINPYGYGNFCLNCLAVLCGPIQPSLIDRRGIITPEYLTNIQTRPPESQNQASSRTYGAVIANQSSKTLMVQDGVSNSAEIDSGVGSLRGSAKIHSNTNIKVVNNGTVVTTLKKKNVSAHSTNGFEDMESLKLPPIEKVNMAAEAFIVMGEDPGAAATPPPQSPDEYHARKQLGRKLVDKEHTNITDGISSSQAYLLDLSSYDLDLDSIDETCSSVPSHSESSQMGLIHPKG